MSIIGPRPVTYRELEWFGDDAAELLSVPAGITGLWQASERNGADNMRILKGKIEKAIFEKLLKATLGS